MIETKQGDSLELIKKLPDDSVDMVLTDPPYLYKDIKVDRRERERESKISKSINRLHNALGGADIISGFDTAEYFKQWLRVLKTPNLVIYCNSEQIKEYLDLIYKYGLDFKLMILKKINPVPYKNPYKSDVEYCFYIYDKDLPFKNYTQDSTSMVFDYVIGSSRPDNVSWHPTTKPLEHAKRLIEKHTQKGDVILDTFMGSGTTGVACKQLGRSFIGYELDPEFYRRATNRINSAKKEITFNFD